MVCPIKCVSVFKCDYIQYKSKQYRRIRSEDCTLENYIDLFCFFGWGRGFKIAHTNVHLKKKIIHNRKF